MMRTLQKKNSFERQVWTQILADLPEQVDENQGMDALIAADYDHGNLTSPYGDVHLRGYFLLPLTHSQCPIPILEDIQSTADYLQLWAIDSNLIRRTEDYRNKFKENNAILLALYLKSFLDLSSGAMSTYLKFSGCFGIIEGMVHNGSVKQNLKPFKQISEFLNALDSVLVPIFSGFYNRVDDVPLCSILGLESVYRCMFGVYKDLVANVPNYNDACGDFISALSSWSAHVSLFSNPETDNWNSDISHKFLRRKSCGACPHIEMILLLANVVVPTEVRKSPIFDMYFKCGSNIICLSKDVLSLRKELEIGQFSRNLVLKKTLKDGMKLPDAVTFVMKLCIDETRDFNRLGYYIAKQYPSCSEITKFISIYSSFVYGSVRVSLEEGHCGHSNYAIKGILKSQKSQQDLKKLMVS